MRKIDRAKLILDTVLSDHQSVQDKNPPCHIGKSRRYIVIPGNNAPRWIIPENPAYGYPVLAQWRPYSGLSRFKWQVLLLLYRLHVIRFIPRIYRLTGEPSKILDLPNSQVAVVAIIYVGTPGIQQKAVATLVDANDGKPLAVMKAVLAKGAEGSLSREAEVLKRLARDGVADVPKLINMDVDGQRTWQTVLVGTSTDRHLTDYHIGWLLQLPESKKTTTLDEQVQRLLSLLGSAENKFSPEQIQQLKDAIGKIKGQNEIPQVLVHGDFVPWNIKQQQNHRLLVMDWEDARFDGLPLWDLCHFHLMQAHLFNETGPINSLLTEQMINQYLEKLGVRQADKQALILLYCLYQIIKGDNVDEAYKGFLLHQIQGERVA